MSVALNAISTAEIMFCKTRLILFYDIVNFGKYYCDEVSESVMQLLYRLYEVYEIDVECYSHA